MPIFDASGSPRTATLSERDAVARFLRVLTHMEGEFAALSPGVPHDGNDSGALTLEFYGQGERRYRLSLGPKEDRFDDFGTGSRYSGKLDSSKVVGFFDFFGAE